MRKFDQAPFPPKPLMVLLTTEFVGPGCKIQWADFKDTHALYFEKAGRFVGFNQDGVVLLGKRDLQMLGGVWILEEDPEMIIKYQNISISQTTLKIIG
jgi:hypothetical protein